MQRSRILVPTILIALLLCLVSDARGGDLKNLEGVWSGSWNSEISDHRGPLKARFNVLGEDKVEARFSGRFFKIVPFRFVVTLDVVSTKDGVTTLKGKQDLGRALGVYHYNATYEDDRFVAKYHTDKDKGVFKVTKN